MNPNHSRASRARVVFSREEQNMAVYQANERAFAKINLFLRITGRREDGYHLLSSVMQTVSLSDDLVILCSDKASEDGIRPGISLTCDVAGIPTDQRNTAYKAARIFLDCLGMPNIGISIHIAKRIPSQAGMGGGSADAAAVLRVLSGFFPGCIDNDHLHKVAEGIGADVPFCLQGGTQLCRGIGDELYPQKSLAGVPLLLIKPSFGVSTPWAFSEIDRLVIDSSQEQRVEERLLHVLFNEPSSGPAERIAAAAPLLMNSFERVVGNKYAEMDVLLSKLRENDAIAARMSGSGSTVFGVFASDEMRNRAEAMLRAELDSSIAIYPATTCETA